MSCYSSYESDIQYKIYINFVKIVSICKLDQKPGKPVKYCDKEI